VKADEERRVAMCSGKDAFRDRRVAEGVARAQNRRREGRIKVYRCPMCRLLHVGTWNGGTVPRTDARAEREERYRYENDFDRRKR